MAKQQKPYQGKNQQLPTDPQIDSATANTTTTTTPPQPLKLGFGLCTFRVYDISIKYMPFLYRQRKREGERKEKY